jgi:hypothetical protein
MAIESYKVGPGSLELGAGPLNVSAQVLSCTVVPSEKVKETDPRPVLSGEELAGSSSASLTWRLKGKVLQDLAAAALVDYSWTNAGEEVAFEYVPNTAEDRAVAGTVRVIPFSIGGDVSKTDAAESDFDWQVIGGIGDATNPLTFGDATP